MGDPAERRPLPSDWLSIQEAADYLGFKVTGIRALIHRGELEPNGRGARRVAMFRRSTLDRFLEARAARYAPDRSASESGGMDPCDEQTEGTTNEHSRRPPSERRALRDPGHVDVPEDREATLTRADRGGPQRRRGGATKTRGARQGEGRRGRSGTLEAPSMRELVAKLRGEGGKGPA